MKPRHPAPLIDSQLIPANAIEAGLNDFALGLQCIGKNAFAAVNRLPTQHISMPILGGDDTLLYELWLADQHCRGGQFQDISFCRTDTLVFGVIEIDESKLGLGAEESALRKAAEIAYRQIFSLLESENCPHLWRTWNYLPDIHAEECGLERYRQFNIGRHHAFVDRDRSVDSSPAASALGTDRGAFSVAFIAGGIEPTRIENPRQISAFAYPAEYGPRSPTFTRAAIVTGNEYETLFISGTASIIGHETVHRGDVMAQARETLVNLAALLERANSRAPAAFYSLQELNYRVYIRHADDYDRVRETLEALAGTSIKATYLQADICRRDLLVEIEAFQVRPRASDTR